MERTGSLDRGDGVGTGLGSAAGADPRWVPALIHSAWRVQATAAWSLLGERRGQAMLRLDFPAMAKAGAPSRWDDRALDAGRSRP